jgi:hypothetical protein
VALSKQKWGASAKKQGPRRQTVTAKKRGTAQTLKTSKGSNSLLSPSGAVKIPGKTP